MRNSVPYFCQAKGTKSWSCLSPRHRGLLHASSPVPWPTGRALLLFTHALSEVAAFPLPTEGARTAERSIGGVRPTSLFLTRNRESPRGDGQRAGTSLGEILRFCRCTSFFSVHPSDTVHREIHGVGHTKHLVTGEFLGVSAVEVGPGLQSPLVHPLVLGPVLTRFHLGELFML